MKAYLQKFSWLLLILGIIACEPEEIPISAHRSGDITTNSVDLTKDYRYQIFYKLNGNEVVAKNLKTAWDIGFESSEEGWHIVLNTSKAMLASSTEETNFSTIINTKDLTWKFDVSNGNLDSTAIGDRRNQKTVYVIDLGYNLEGVKMGFKKVIFESYDNSHYTFKFADLDGTNEMSFRLTKNPSKNFTCFSFETQSIIEAEADKDSWDICFTQYQHLFYNDQDIAFPYLVTGVLLNPNHTKATLDTLIGFESFTYEDVDKVSLSTNLSVIGYDWKTYDYDASSFTINTKQNYIIKDGYGFYHKLHFIDFYNEKGEKGYPVFKSQQL